MSQAFHQSAIPNPGNGAAPSPIRRGGFVTRENFGVINYYRNAARKRIATGEPWFWQFLILGYTTFGKSFAYLGVPPLFLAEAFMGYSILRNRGRFIDRFLRDLLDLKILPVTIVLVVLWGMVEVLRPFLDGGDVIGAFRTSAFNYYPLLIPIGMSLGREITIESFIRFWKGYSFFYGAYAVFYVSFAANVFIPAPWRGDLELFMLPAIGPLAPTAILALWPLYGRWPFKWILLCTSMIPLLFSSGRGSLLGLVLSLAAVAATSARQFKLVVGMLFGGFLLLTIIGPLFKGEAGRTETLDPIIQVARVIATFDEDAAYKMLQRRGYQAAADDMIVASGTANWRKQIWSSSMHSLNTTSLVLMGQGHGASMLPHIPDGQEITTPHNFVIYGMFYTGVIGMTLFGTMLAALLGASWMIREPHLRAFQTGLVLMMVMLAAVGNMFETPISAVPFYLLSGVCLGLNEALVRRGVEMARLMAQFAGGAGGQWRGPALYQPLPLETRRA